MKRISYVVAATRPWNRRVFDERIAPLPGEWHFIDDRSDLTVETLLRLQPRFVFFIHWSWIVPREVLDRFECVCFHMTDVPFGRGGSPLQNLIVRGYHSTKLSALRMVEVLDAGPVYLKRELSLEGTAQEIYVRTSNLAATMIGELIERCPEPVEQIGQVVEFRRRKPAESRIPPGLALEDLHDFIRMLDADGYPRAFLETPGLRYEFSAAVLTEGTLQATVRITPIGQPSE